MKLTSWIRLAFAECYGTFLLVLLGTGSIVFNPEGGIVPIALAFGMAVMIAIYTVGPISGAHLNPIVTLSLWLHRKLSLNQMVLYWGSQILGACLATLVIWSASSFSGFSGLGASTFALTTPDFLAVLFEAIGTFILVLLILTVSNHQHLSHLSGLLIGMTLTGLILVIGPFSSASFNPFRSLIPALFEQGTSLSQLWVFFVGPILGAILATSVFNGLNPKVSLR